MFVRVEPDAAGLRVETCPISGTIWRGADALEDAANIKTSLSDPKEESELTMCTDDRNDKSRICEPGSVKIEMYSSLIHTVDHVKGYLRPGYDALNAFLCHITTWRGICAPATTLWMPSSATCAPAVTVTDAPKLWAMRFVEKHERSQRAWYGGAIGMAGFDGRINTGLTLRTVHIQVSRCAQYTSRNNTTLQHSEMPARAGATLLYDSVPPKPNLNPAHDLRAPRPAHKSQHIFGLKDLQEPTDSNNNHGETSVRAGATLLYDSVPALEEAETELKVGASAMREALATAKKAGIVAAAPITVKPSVNGAAFAGLHVLLVDHQVKHWGILLCVCEAQCWLLDELNPELVVLSPGPGNPRDFKCSELLAELERRKGAVFGVCLELQAMVLLAELERRKEHFGGELHVLPHPQNGKPVDVRLVVQESSPPSMLSHGLPNTFQSSY
ncbi:ADC synthase [Pavlovales sp. CCMP2436]|nr:ADC synthase [Pavlovales sp. CCMP2436]